MTLLRGDHGSLFGNISRCVACDQPVEPRGAVVVYASTGSQLLHGDCWRPGKPVNPTTPRAQSA